MIVFEINVVVVIIVDEKKVVVSIEGCLCYLGCVIKNVNIKVVILEWMECVLVCLGIC